MILTPNIFLESLKLSLPYFFGTPCNILRVKNIKNGEGHGQVDSGWNASYVKTRLTTITNKLIQFN